MGPRSCRAQDRGVREPLSAETRVRHLLLVLGVAAGTVALDQATKWWAVRTLDDHTIDLVWTLRLHLVTNTGAAFSLGQALGPLIAVGVLIVVGVLLWTGRTVGTRLGALGLGLVLGGAIGNLLDRVFRTSDSLLGGAVVDFIDFQWWPVFNVADMGVFVGAMLLLLANWREGELVADE